MLRSYGPFAVLEKRYPTVFVMSHDVTLASGGGVNKSTPSVNTSNPGLPRVTTHAQVSHLVPGTRGIHRWTRRMCRYSESEESRPT